MDLAPPTVRPLLGAPGPMRVALVIERFEPGIGGVENVAWRLAEGLDNALRALARARLRARHWGADACNTDKCTRRPRARGVSERVRLVGCRSDLPACFAAADARVRG